MKKSIISLLIKSQGKQLIPMLRLNESLALSTCLTPSSNVVITTTNAYLAPNKLRLLRLSGLILSSLALSVVLSPIANAALSATTANTIKGTLPALSFDGVTAETDLDELLSFTMPDPAGGATPIAIDPTTYPTATPVNAKGGITFNDFTVKVVADGAAKNLSSGGVIAVAGLSVLDDDGDNAHPTTPVGGTLKATWSYQQGTATKTVTAGDLGDTLEACNAPYTLKLEANNVDARTEYGDPNINPYANQTHTYTVNVNDYKICYAKPANMTVFTWCTTANCAYASGHNPDVFVPALGFIPKANRPTSAKPNFPTSGFDGAIFTLVMSNNQSDYTYVSSNGLAVVNASGEVTLNNGGNPLLGNQTVTITATPSDASFPSQTYQFTVQASQWARVPTQPATGTQYNTNMNFTGTYPAAELCGAPAAPSPAQLNGKADHYGAGKASSYFFSRSDFTKSAIALMPDRLDVATGAVVPAGGIPTYGGYFSRDINGAFLDEWGDLWTGNPYSTSGFGSNVVIWTAEAFSSIRQFVVTSSSGVVGGVGGDSPSNTILAVCR